MKYLTTMIVLLFLAGCNTTMFEPKPIPLPLNPTWAEIQYSYRYGTMSGLQYGQEIKNYNLRQKNK